MELSDAVSRKPSAKVEEVTDLIMGLRLYDIFLQEEDAKEDEFVEIWKTIIASKESEFDLWKATITLKEIEFDSYKAFIREPGVAKRTDGEEEAPVEPPSDREDPISSSKNARSGIEKRISRRPPSPPPSFACEDVGCTWPCAHHLHTEKEKRAFSFLWVPDLERVGHRHPQMPRLQSEMKDCQFCQIFFSLGQSDCDRRGNGGDRNRRAMYNLLSEHSLRNAPSPALPNDHILKSGLCGYRSAYCVFKSNWQLSHVFIFRTCGHLAMYELGSTGKVVWSLYDLPNESSLTRR